MFGVSLYYILNKMLSKLFRSKNITLPIVPTRNYLNQKAPTPLDFDPKTNYYKVLNVKENASKSEIKNGYMRLTELISIYR
jgi:hypothetical protein